MHKLVLIRHGQSRWNEQNRFTGWTDVDLSAKGRQEAKDAGDVLKAGGYTFDVAYTSVLKRAIRTLWIVLDEMDLMWIPVQRSWRLNERHYGALQGLNKAETAAKHGAEQVMTWRRSYDIPPPPLVPGGAFDLSGDRRYAGIDVPATETLKSTLERVRPYWDSEIEWVQKQGLAGYPVFTRKMNTDVAYLAAARALRGLSRRRAARNRALRVPRLLPLG